MVLSMRAERRPVRQGLLAIGVGVFADSADVRELRTQSPYFSDRPFTRHARPLRQHEIVLFTPTALRSTMTRAAHQQADVVRLKRLGIDTYQELVVFMARSSPVCRSEGWGAQSRVLVALNGRSIVATLNVTTNGLLAPDEASLSEAAWLALGATNGDLVRLSHAGPVDSLSALRAKVYGEKLSEQAIQSIIRDIVAGRYADIELAAFVTAFAREKVDVDEATALTRAMEN